MYPGLDRRSKKNKNKEKTDKKNKRKSKNKNKEKTDKKNKRKKMNVVGTEVWMKEDLQAPPSSFSFRCHSIVPSEYQRLEEDTEVPVQGSSR